MLALIKNPYAWISFGLLSTAIYLLGFYDGKEAERMKQTKEVIRSVENASQIHQEINRIPDGSAARSLREHWTRK